VTLERLRASLSDRYRIERELGQGGMATVYLAEDLKHHRKVALKVLRAELAAILGAERFLHEIRTTANLQHPHILPLHDSGQVESTVFYVMPFVDGETLRDRLSREKQLPVEDAVRIASQVAGALDYAHRQGVIHRDIKPENILLHDGSALVADFGIALAASSTGGGRMTETGMSLGTPHYMSPEQAMGEREITARSDVYALGVVTYEMLTGDPPFTGSSAQAIVARVMTEEPRPLTLQRKSIPPHVEAAVLTALEKLPADRFSTAAQFAEALARPDAWAMRTRATRAHADQPGAPLVKAIPWALLVLAGTAAIWGWARREPSALSGAVIASTIVLPDSAPLAFIGKAPLAIGRTALALSPDGATLAYVAQRGAGTQLYLRPMDRDTAFPVPGTEDACCPFFSPDGAWLAFHARDQLSKVRLGFAGAPIPILTVNSFFGADWGDDGWIVVSDLQGRRVLRVNAETGVKEDLHLTMSRPHVLPGGRGVISDTSLFPSGGQEPRRLLAAGTDSRFAATGHITYAHQGALWAVPFDLSRLTVTGEPLAVVQHLRTEASRGAGQYTFANDGLLVYAQGAANDLSRLVSRSRSGRVDTLPFEPARFGCLSLSPDGDRIAARIADAETGQWDVWVYDLVRGSRLRLTTSGGLGCPSFLPDGRITYVTRSGDDATISAQAATGRESPSTILTRRLNVTPSAVRWSPDGRQVAAYLWSDSTGSDIVVLDLDSAAALHSVATTPALEWGGIFSPDGRWIAYSSSESGTDEIYVQPWPLTGRRWRVSRSGGEEPLWTKGGRELIYRAGNEWWRVSVTGSGELVAGEPELVARGPWLNVSGVEYAASSDGERLYLLAPMAGTATTTRLTVVSNWFSILTELSRRARQ
jgi:serine/threonine-protein kinase